MDRRHFLAAIAALTAGSALPRTLWGQATGNSPLADPRDFALQLTAGPIRPGDGKRVICQSTNGKPAVGRALVEVGQSRVVLLPNGRLLGMLERDTTATDQPFQPASMQEVAAELTEKQFRGFQVKNTKRYLYIYNTSELFYTATSRILETMFPGVQAYCKNQKLAVNDPETPMVVIMFRTEQEFQAYQEMPQGVVAYYTPVSNYIVMYEQSRLNQIAPDIALRQSITTIAHEGAHQILHNIGVQQRLSRWPMWISEGLAEYFAPTSTDKRMTWKGAGNLNDLRLVELDAYLKQRPADARGDLVELTVQAGQLTSTGYATAWALTHYLAKRQPLKFFGYLQEIAKIGPMQGNSRPDMRGRLPENLQLFVKHFGSDVDALEQQVVLHLRKLLTG